MKTAADKEALRRALMRMKTVRAGRDAFGTGLEELDHLAPGGAFQRGAVHELIWMAGCPSPWSLALLLAKSARQAGGAIVWGDPERELHLPAVSAAGIDLRHLILLRCGSRADQLWALAESLRCRGVSATVAPVDRLSQIEARRLQLAAEHGGGIGIFMRPGTRGISACYAAATRWLIEPAPGDERVQRWSVQLLHGHGGQVGKVLLVEVNRETRALHISAPLADRSAVPTAPRAAG